MEKAAWNNELRLVLSDVDETIADVYKPAEPEMVAALSAVLASGIKLFMVTGGSLARVRSDITDAIAPSLRSNILISHCSGAEVWGFDQAGNLRSKPFYSVYEETFTPEMKQLWRDKTRELISEFGFHTYGVQPKLEFAKQHPGPLDIMYDDRGPQITLELINAHDLTDSQLAELSHEVPETHGNRDLRIPVLERAEQIFDAAGVPITPRLGGTFALDLAIKGVSKTTSIRRVLSDPEVLATVGLSLDDVTNPQHLEIWGDKFSTLRGGTDRHMSQAVDPAVRSINFRDEDPAEFDPGYNVVLWTGQKHLHHGLLEYLQTRA